VRFDIERCKARTGKLEYEDLDFDAFVTDPLSPDALRCLRYMHDVEYHTVCFLRDILVTSAHRDHDIASFLTFWNFEEFWHGEALGKVLAMHGEKWGGDRIVPLRRSIRIKESLKPFMHGIGSIIAGKELAAVQMTWGAINESTAQAAYGRLAVKAGHPVLAELLKRIKMQEGRHLDFYASQAQRRLDGNTRAQKWTRFALRRFWAPVGSELAPRAECAHMVSYLFDDEDGRAAVARIDQRVDRLPGLQGLEVVKKAVASYLADPGTTGSPPPSTHRAPSPEPLTVDRQPARV